MTIKKPIKTVTKRYGKNYTTLYWTPSKGKTIDKESIRSVFNELKKTKPNIIPNVKAEMAGSWRTISQQGELKLQDEEEYYEGKVKDVDDLVEIEKLVIRYYED